MKDITKARILASAGLLITFYLNNKEYFPWYISLPTCFIILARVWNFEDQSRKKDSIAKK